MSPPVRPPAVGALTAGVGVWETFDAWLRRSSEVIGESSEALNALNVFPISDADTGSNLKLTLAGIARAVPDVNRASVDAVVQAAILSAHGNSGAIVAEMFSSVCRSLQHPSLPMAAGSAGHRVALLLRTVADAAERAVARPVAGTILTVAADAAEAAERAALTDPDDALAVARAAQAEAWAALRRTPDQLEVLAAAGVVDAGGQAYALLVDALVEVLGGEPARPVPPLSSAPVAVPETAGSPDYEVMYVLRDASREGLAALRDRLSDLGSSVVVVGEDDGERGGLAQVHAHLADPGAGVEAGLAVGQLSQIRITALESSVLGNRLVVALVAGAGFVDPVLACGAVPVLATGERPVADELAAALRRGGGDVVVLPHDLETLETASHLVATLRAERRSGHRPRRLAVIPTVAQVQALAALAVHDPDADFDSAVTAMSAAAGHTRYGAVTVAGSATMTTAGRCPAGAVLGSVEDDVVEVGDSALEVAGRVVDRLLAGGGELLTLAPGAAAPPGLAEEVARRSRSGSSSPLEVQVVPGGQPGALLLVGLE